MTFSPPVAALGTSLVRVGRPFESPSSMARRSPVTFRRVWVMCTQRQPFAQYFYNTPSAHDVSIKRVEFYVLLSLHNTTSITNPCVRTARALNSFTSHYVTITLCFPTYEMSSGKARANWRICKTYHWYQYDTDKRYTCLQRASRNTTVREAVMFAYARRVREPHSSATRETRLCSSGSQPEGIKGGINWWSFLKLRNEKSLYELLSTKKKKKRKIIAWLGGKEIIKFYGVCEIFE